MPSSWRCAGSDLGWQAGVVSFAGLLVLGAVDVTDSDALAADLAAVPRAVEQVSARVAVHRESFGE
jgi:hypothetical protein